MTAKIIAERFFYAPKVDRVSGSGRAHPLLQEEIKERKLGNVDRDFLEAL